MKFTIDRESILGPIQLVSGVVEKRQTMAVLSNLLCVSKSDSLFFTGTDQEVEISAGTNKVVSNVTGNATIPAKKLLDICRTLGVSADITFELKNNRLNIRSGRFNSSLATLPTESFPTVEMGESNTSLTISANKLYTLLEKTSFAMAQQDVRYFFNGMLFEIEGSSLRAVATNGQRLATTAIELSETFDAKKQFIVPRKGVVELSRMIKDNGDENVFLSFNDNHMQVKCGLIKLTTKLIDAQYPEYQKVMSTGGDKTVILDRLDLKEALSRIAILSNEVYRNIRLTLSEGLMSLNANNPLQEEAEETIAIDYNGEEMEIGFNVVYLIEVLKALKEDKVSITLQDANSAMLISSPSDDRSMFVVSPMML